MATKPANTENRFVNAAIIALEAHTNATGIDSHSNRVAMYHLLHSLIDLSEKEGFSFAGLVRQVCNDRDS